MELFSILNQSDVFNKSFVDNCKEIGTDINNFDLSNFMKKTSIEFENTLKKFITDLKNGIRAKWKWISICLILILIFLLWGIKIKYNPLKIVILLLIQVGLIMGRKFLWRFILILSKDKKINTLNTIIKWIIQKIIQYYCSSVLRSYLFQDSILTKSTNIFKNINKSIFNIIDNILMSSVGVSLIYILYIKPLKENRSFDYVAKNYAGLSFLVGIIIMESFVTESLYRWNLNIKEGWIQYLIDMVLDYFVSYILIPIGIDIV